MTHSSRTALVTGGASGFGAAVVQRFVVAGYAVVIADVDAAKGAALAAEIGAAACFASCDIRRRDDALAAVRLAVETFGGLDILINNAGVGWAGGFAEASDADVDRVLGVDLIGPLTMTQAALPALLASAERQSDPGPAIVFTASGLGLKASAGVSLYAVAKHGVVGLMRSLAAELGPRGVRVNAVCPGIVDTPAVRSMWGESLDEALERFRQDRPLKRDILPDDVAAAIAFLAGPDARAIHSVALAVDGGRLG